MLKRHSQALKNKCKRNPDVPAVTTVVIAAVNKSTTICVVMARILVRIDPSIHALCGDP
jgi:hypothetical protein